MSIEDYEIIKSVMPQELSGPNGPETKDIHIWQFMKPNGLQHSGVAFIIEDGVKYIIQPIAYPNEEVRIY